MFYLVKYDFEFFKKLYGKMFFLLFSVGGFAATVFGDQKVCTSGANN